MKKKITVSLILLISILSFGCSKENDEPEKPDCEVNKYGTVTVSNSSSNPYDLYIDNVFKMQIPGNTITEKIRISEGNGRKLYAKQISLMKKGLRV